MSHFALLTLVVFALPFGLFGCSRDPGPTEGHTARASESATRGVGAAATTTTTSQEASPSEHHYSPFVLDVSGPQSLPFHVISFKDVGLTSDSDTAALYESLAESLAAELMTPHEVHEADAAVAVAVQGAHPGGDAPMSLQSVVRHDVEVTDPAHHMACESGHIYVDVWRAGEHSDGDYGYSLWAGCGDDDRFAYNAAVSPGQAPGDDLLASVEPLTRDIAASLRRAVETQCFQRAC